MQTLLTILACIFVGDLITGLVHWWEDTYGDPDWPVIGEHIVKPNIEHHEKPGLIGSMSTIISRNVQSLGSAILVAGLVLWVAFCFGTPPWECWPVFLTVFLAGLGNEVHTWNHRADRDNNVFVRFLQDSGLIQSRVQHGKHHRKPYDKYYCTLTNFTNAVLERIHFWRTLEWLILVVLRIPVKRGDPKRNGY